MLFDLKGKRKRVVQVTYVILASCSAAAWCCSGPAAASAAACRRDHRQHSGTANSAVPGPGRAQPRRPCGQNPKSEQAWLDLTRAQFNLAASPEGSDAETGQLNDTGKQAVLEAINAWERYLKLEARRSPTRRTAQFAALAYGATQDYEQGVETQAARGEVDGRARTRYFQLAQFAYCRRTT